MLRQNATTLINTQDHTLGNIPTCIYCYSKIAVHSYSKYKQLINKGNPLKAAPKVVASSAGSFLLAIMCFKENLAVFLLISEDSICLQ